MTGYQYRGRIRDAGGLDLEQANAQIMAARDHAAAFPEAGFEWPNQRRRRLAEQNRCGTDAGYKRHRKHHEGPCEPCRIAHNAANQARKARQP